MPHLIDLHGKRFGRLMVEKISGKQGCETTWECLCDCGNRTIVTGGNLRSGRTKSCGCILKETSRNRMLRHGHSGERLYRIWKDMKTRCGNPRSTGYQYWGGKGIKVCDDWESSYENFRRWAMQNGYENTLSIDRIDGNGNYEPSNCRWVDSFTQNANRKFTREEVRNA